MHIGPAVTQGLKFYRMSEYKVSKILNLTDDIALALAAKGIRIEAPIPGNQRLELEVAKS